jgi:hypothetical protein
MIRHRRWQDGVLVVDEVVEITAAVVEAARAEERRRREEVGGCCKGPAVTLQRAGREPAGHAPDDSD